MIDSVSPLFTAVQTSPLTHSPLPNHSRLNFWQPENCPALAALQCTPSSCYDGCLGHTRCPGPTWYSGTAKLHVWLRPPVQGRTALTHPSCLPTVPDILPLAPVLSHQAEALPAPGCR